jgi:predicted MPP superfamily phosphohydrolase
VRLRTGGRGGGYSPWRGLLESVLRIAYRGDWPAHLWSHLPRARKVSITRHRLLLPAGNGEPCRIAFISDLHVGPTTPVSLLERAFAVIRENMPDVLLLGGDYVFLDAEPDRLAVLAGLVESVACQVKLAVLGNHDLWTSDAAIVEALTGAGARVLVNEAAALPPPWSDVVVVGLDDPWTGRCEPSMAAAQLNGEPVRIVLCHSPDGLMLLSGLRFDLFLCGHTHGGQVAGPWGPIILPHGPMCRTFPSGLRAFGSGTVYVSRGIGGVELPIRTFAPPDIMLLELIRLKHSENERAAQQGDEADEAQGGTRTVS